MPWAVGRVAAAQGSIKGATETWMVDRPAAHTGLSGRWA